MIKSSFHRVLVCPKKQDTAGCNTHLRRQETNTGRMLGEQAIGQAFGGKLVNLSTVFHGVQTIIRLTEPDYIFRGLPEEIAVGRYHSWVVDTEKLPETLAVTAVSPEGQIMALKHREYDVRGIQFHPESVLTPDGKQIMKNWLEE